MTDSEILKAMYADIQTMKQNVQDMKTEMLDMKQDILDTNQNIQTMSQTVQKTQHDIKDLQITLETVTNENINIIAEGHLDLTRKLDDALKVENEKEMIQLRVNYLENEVRRLKSRMDEIA